MWGFKKKGLATIIAILLMISIMPISSAQAKPTKSANDKEVLGKTQVVDLIAGQNQKVGAVTIERNGDRFLRATYELDADAIKNGWLIYEIHFAIGDDLSDIPQTKGNKWGTNPIPGQFPYKRYFQNGVKKDVLEGIDVSRYQNSKDLYIAAHAVVKKTNSKTIKAPYSGTRIYDYEQGLDYNGDPVITLRSNPENGLYYETGMSEENFYSLGFSGVDMDSGWIIIEFEYPITNGKGDDLEVIEDTWMQPYNVEQAVVSISNDKKHWKTLGVAGNDNPISKYHTSTKFDLSDVCMKSAKYVKLQDVSDSETAAIKGNPTDGFDLNAVLALHDYINSCNKYTEETAWAEGSRFNEKGSWAMYFTFQINSKDNSCSNSFYNKQSFDLYKLIKLFCYW